MFLLIEVDKDFSLGIDWGKYIKGFRLGFIAIHVVNVKFTEYLEACVMYKTRKERK